MYSSWLSITGDCHEYDLDCVCKYVDNRCERAEILEEEPQLFGVKHDRKIRLNQQRQASNADNEATQIADRQPSVSLRGKHSH